MKRVIAAAILFVAASYAIASCPPNAPYRCISTFGGKQICGCGV